MCIIICSSQEKKDIYIIKDSLNYSFATNKTDDFDVLKKELTLKGYFFYNVRSFEKDSINRHIVDPGQDTKTIAINNSSEEIALATKSNEEKIYIEPNSVVTFLEQLTAEFDNAGQNFTQVKFINQKLINDTLFCDLSIHQSKKRYVDKVVVKGYTKFSKRFKKRYIYSKKVFSKELLKETENKINQLSFVKNKQKPAVLFTKDSTHLYLYLDRVKANKLDALIGFSNQEGESRIQFNGYVDISLTNVLHKGETFAFKWNNSGQDQQEIGLSINNPYIFGSPLNVKFDLNIFRQDSSFVNTKQLINISYKPHYKHNIGVYYQKEQSTSIDDITQQYDKDIVGLHYLFKEVNNWRIPKSKVELTLGYGNRKTEITSKQQIIESDLIYNFELNTNNHIYTQNRNAYLRSPNKTINELYRVGGATSMRGFLEQSIISDLYNYTNIEYRYFNNPISYLYAFSDIGYFKNLSDESNLLSFGLGYTLGTPSGLLKISYAVGKSQETNFNLSNGLFHINFVTIF
ncbi:hypothetical protein ACXGQW_08115 [Wenyingzhuangia sp. IMCC45533]